MREIERRGGKLFVNPRLPDELAEAFLADVLACPDCANAPDLPAFDDPLEDSFDLPLAGRDRSGH